MKTDFRIHPHVAIPGLFALTALLYKRELALPPHFDDHFYLFLMDETPLRHVLCVLDPRQYVIWIRPINWLLTYVERALFGDWLAGFRLVTVLMHAINGYLLYWICRRPLGLTATTSSLCGLLFVLYPGSYESVLWLSDQVDPQLLLCQTGSFVTYTRWRDRSGIRWLFLSFLLFLFGLMTKETVVVLPGILLLFECFRRRIDPSDEGTNPWVVAAGLLPFFILTAGYLVLRHEILGGIGGYPQWAGGIPRHLMDIRRLLAYFTVVLPSQYLFPFPYHDVSFLYRLPGALMFWITLGGLIVSRDYRIHGIFCTLCCILLVIPVSPLIWKSHDFFMNPRYLYPGSGAVCLMVACMLRAGWREPDRRRTWKFCMRIAGWTIVCAWLPLGWHLRSTFRAATELSNNMIDQLSEYCTDLNTDTQIVLSGLPCRIGSTSLDIMDPVLSITNFEIHRRCALLPPFDPCARRSERTLREYLLSARGVVSPSCGDSMTRTATPALKSRRIFLRLQPDGDLRESAPPE